MSTSTTARPSSRARKYSERLGVLNERQFQTALDRFGLGSFVKAEPISCGLFGQNVYITSTQGEWVLRGCPHGPWQFPKERWIANWLHEHTDVPVPWPYRVETEADVFGWSFVLMPRMPGHVPVDTFYDGLSVPDREAISFAMGECLARMHTPAGPCFGEYDLAGDAIRPRQEGYAAWFLSGMAEGITHSRADGCLTADDANWLEERIARARTLMETPFPPCFVMQDFKRGNLTVRREGAGWKVSGVFDLMEPYFGDGEADLWRHLADASQPESRAFLQGYLSRKRFRPGHAERMTVYFLCDRLSIWSYGHRPGADWFKKVKQTFREWVQPKLTKVDLAVELAAERKP